MAESQLISVEVFLQFRCGWTSTEINCDLACEINS